MNPGLLGWLLFLATAALLVGVTYATRFFQDVASYYRELRIRRIERVLDGLRRDAEQNLLLIDLETRRRIYGEMEDES